jgi:hypothetical protein
MRAGLLASHLLTSLSSLPPHPPSPHQAFAKEKFVWTRALCLADSDGDGLTNGEELGDPCCVWAPGGGGGDATHTPVSHPGRPDAAPPPGLARRSHVCGVEKDKHSPPVVDAAAHLQTAVITPDPSDPTGAAFFADFRPVTPFTVPPNATTTYGALPFNLPSPDGPGGRHTYDIVAIEPLLDPASTGALHHFDFALCRGLDPRPGVQVETPGAATAPHCSEAVYVWTAGGAPIHRLPEGAGLRYGKGTPIGSFRLGTHYHTPLLEDGSGGGGGGRNTTTTTATTRRAVSDRTGVRLHITRRLRAGEAALFWAGPISHGVGTIPPGKGAWYAGSTCRPQLAVRPRGWWAAHAPSWLGGDRGGRADPDDDSGGVSVYAFLPHMHKLGRAQGVSLLRPRRFVVEGENEGGNIHSTSSSTSIVYDVVASLGAATNYSYSATHYVHLDEEVRVRPGDILATTCVYDSSKKTEAVHGGLGSDDEMCIAFLAAHPASAAGAARHCQGVVSAGEYTPYAGVPPGGPDPAPALPAVDAGVRGAPVADWHLELSEGRLACDWRALAATRKAAQGVPDPGSMLAAACGEDWARLMAGPASLRRAGGAWVAGHGPPDTCSLGCARTIYNWLACSRSPHALGPDMGGLALLAAAVEPIADLACGAHLAAGAMRPPVVSTGAVVVGGIVAGCVAFGVVIRRRRRAGSGAGGGVSGSPGRLGKGPRYEAAGRED